MRILIYLLAMMSGFSAAEAARPLSSASASVDMAVTQVYVAAAAFEAASASEPSVCVVSIVRLPLVSAIGEAIPAALTHDTPVVRHDIILG